MKFLDVLATIFLIIAGLNWGLSLFGFDAVNWLLSAYPQAIRALAGLAGLSGLWQIFRWKAIQHHWNCNC